MTPVELRYGTRARAVSGQTEALGALGGCAERAIH
jgi:hypothetical protein